MAEPRNSGRDARRPTYAAIAALGIAALTFAVYARGFGHQFVDWDDWDYVLDNALVTGRHWGALLRAVVALNFHPLTLLSLALDVRAPLSPRPFLVTNVALHALDTLLAFALAWRLSAGRIRVAAFVALLFGVALSAAGTRAAGSSTSALSAEAWPTRLAASRSNWPPSISPCRD